jgi:hypothetical protein
VRGGRTISTARVTSTSRWAQWCAAGARQLGRRLRTRGFERSRRTPERTALQSRKFVRSGRTPGRGALDGRFVRSRRTSELTAHTIPADIRQRRAGSSARER